MRSGILGMFGAAKDMTSVPRSSLAPPNGRHLVVEQDERPLPVLLSSRNRFPDSSSKLKAKNMWSPELLGPSVTSVHTDSFLPDFDQKLGTGAYGGVYAVKDSPDKVVKIFQKDDWHEVVKESLFAQEMKAQDPAHFVGCFGIGVTSDFNGGQKHFAVFERAEGITLEHAATRFSSPQGLTSVREALEVVEQLAAIMMNMMQPDSHGNLHFHLDLKPENIIVSKTQGGEIKVTLIDYGVVGTCKHEDAAAVQDSSLQMLRWLGWELLWALSSEQFVLEGLGKTPWEQLPEGFRPFFQRSDFRPPAYHSSKLSPEHIRTAMEDSFFSRAMSPGFRLQWNHPDEGKRLLGSLLGDLFYGVALASDRNSFSPDFSKIRAQIKELKDQAVAAP
eukprot:TRINITY_DN13872_c0_g1_i1.p1 TRINITY_DN13872_c0_g1~~TRINITY_DN13872_c0_g1_i1.p1  ORF type:complete len:389 (+),score=80.33 TRINITY_DN13872_c0_g1_i1:51-1217(+)